jgi:hypothetical protein
MYRLALIVCLLLVPGLCRGETFIVWGGWDSARITPSGLGQYPGGGGPATASLDFDFDWPPVP